jgi:hypothetical protein
MIGRRQVLTAHVMGGQNRCGSFPARSVRNLMQPFWVQRPDSKLTVALQICNQARTRRLAVHNRPV